MKTLNSLHCINGNGQRFIINAKALKSLYIEDVMQRRVFDDEDGTVYDFQMAKFIAFEFDPNGMSNPTRLLEQNKVTMIELRFSDGLVDTYYAYWGTPSLDKRNYSHNRNQHVEVMKNGLVRVYINERRKNDPYCRSSRGNEVGKDKPANGNVAENK